MKPVTDLGAKDDDNALFDDSFVFFFVFNNVSVSKETLRFIFDKVCVEHAENQQKKCLSTFEIFPQNLHSLICETFIGLKNWDSVFENVLERPKILTRLT